MLHIIVSVSNDAISKFLGDRLPSLEITFIRFIFSALTLLPFISLHGLKSLKTSNISMHTMRGIILFIGINLWVRGLNTTPITMVTIINFTIPMFVLILAVIFLREKVSLQLWMATILGFIGVYITLNPHDVTFDPNSLILVVGALTFAILDIINKKFVIQETMLGMLFYPSLVMVILGIVPAYQLWITPTNYELALLLCLGAGSNLVLFCILKAFSLLNASVFSPYRYLEIAFSSSIGYLVFSEVPSMSLLLGCAIVIPASLYITMKNYR